MGTWEWESGSESLGMGTWEWEPGNESLGMGVWEWESGSEAKTTIQASLPGKDVSKDSSVR